MTNKSNILSVGGAVLFKESKGKKLFLVVKQRDEEKWEFAKIGVRKGESSVRSVLRMTGEMASIDSKVLEEAGRFSSAGTLNGRVLSQKYYYYLMMYKSGGSEMMGFEQVRWMDYAKALKNLSLKREKDILKNAKKVLKEWEKKHPKKKRFS